MYDPRRPIQETRTPRNIKSKNKTTPDDKERSGGNKHIPPTEQTHTRGFKIIPPTIPQKYGILVLGDFNCQHVAWGYHNTTTAGRKLEDAQHQAKYSLLNDITRPTRTGNSVQRDTNPDLAFYRGTANPTWDNMEENLGSDHNIIVISIPLTTTETHKPRPTAITDWHKSRQEPSPTLNLDNPDEWTQEILAQTEKHTTYINTTPDIPYVDHHILTLWETRRALIKRWKKRKTNRNLKKRIRLLTEQAQEYAIKLAYQNWWQLCDSLNPHMSTKRVWSLLRSMIQPTVH